MTQRTAYLNTSLASQPVTRPGQTRESLHGTYLSLELTILPERNQGNNHP